MHDWTPFAGCARSPEGAGGGGAEAAAADSAAAAAAAAQASPDAAAQQAAAAAKPWIETAALLPERRNVVVNNGFHKVRGEDGAVRDATVDEIVDKVVGAYDAAARKLGKDPALLMDRPKGRDDVDWWKANRQAFGVPDKPEDYGVKRPELPEGMAYDEAFERETLAAFAEAGMPPHLAQLAVDRFAGKMAAMWQGASADATAARQQMMQELTRDWGAQAETRISQAARAFQALAAEVGIPPEQQPAVIARLTADLGGPGKGDAQVIRLMHAVFSKMGEASMPEGLAAGGFGATTPVEAEARLSQIKGPTGEWAQAVRANDRAKQDALQAEIARLSAIIAGGAKR